VDVVTGGQAMLAEARRQAAVSHVLRAARRYVATHGLDVTVDEIAEAADVSRSTMFRLFSTRDELVAAAISAGLSRYGELLPTYDGADWRLWLHELCQAVHQMNDSCGPGFWELTTRRNLPPALSAVEQQRRRGQREVMNGLAKTLWSAANGVGRPPQPLVSAVAAYLGPHFTAAVRDDASRDWRHAAAMAESAIAEALAREVRR
jgi:AcrR family transcriptional regulator